jgi:glycosyltransferase involved in cell wall biosynthesis
MMKILVFTTLYPNNMRPNHGVFIVERMRHVAKHKGCALKVVAPVPYYPSVAPGWRQIFSQVMRFKTIDGIEVYHPRYFMIPKIGMSLYGLMMFLSVLPIMRRIKRSFDFDLIDAHFVYPDGFAAIMLGGYFGKPVVVSARGSDINLYKDLLVIRGLLRYTLLKADGVISVSQALKDEMIRLDIQEDKIFVIPNGVDTDKFYPVSKKEARRKLGLPLDKKVILSVGALISLKGFDLLIKAMKVLVDEFHQQNLYLVIVGEGELRAKLNKLIRSLDLEEYVSLVGGKPHEDLYLWNSAADLFCLASSREGWPNVVMEALACGTPVVATPVGGIPEIIHSDRLGLLKERNVAALAGGISDAMQKTWDKDIIRGYAMRRSWYEVAPFVFNVYESVIDTKDVSHLKRPSRHKEFCENNWPK